MPSYKNKISPVFLSPDDEIELINKTTKANQAVAIIDGSIWESSQPPVKKCIADCRSPVVFLWDRVASPTLPFLLQKNGSVRGPTSGLVIQYVRCQLKNDILLSGDFSIGFDRDDNLIERFATNFWKVLRDMNSGPLESIDTESGAVLMRNIREYVVGPSAQKMSLSGFLLKHDSAEAYYRSSSKENTKGTQLIV